MRSFTDTAGRRWTISLNVTAAKRVRDMCDVNLLAVIDEPQILTDLSSDVIKLVDVLYVLCKPQCDAEGISDEQFGEALSGESIDLATTAFLNGLVDFFPGARHEVLKRIVRRAEQHAVDQENQVLKAIEGGDIDRAMDAVMKKHTLAPTAGTTSTD